MIPTDDANVLLEQLERLGQTLGIQIRYECLGEDREGLPIRSGLCRLHKRRILLIENRLSVAQKCDVLVKAFKTLDSIDVFVPPAIRRLIDDSEGDY
jgi:hypothetical protein